MVMTRINVRINRDISKFKPFLSTSTKAETINSNRQQVN